MSEKLDKLLQIIKHSEKNKFTGEVVLYFHNGSLSNKIGQKKMFHILDVHKLDHSGIGANEELLTI